MKFTQLAFESGDCTAPYFVTDYKAKTVGEFIQEVLKERSSEWGYIFSWQTFLSIKYNWCVRISLW